MEKCVAEWHASIDRVTGIRNRGNNKLRVYRLFKTSFEAELYCKIILPYRHRSAFAKFRCGVAPLRIETGRYENLNLEDRICPFCRNACIESEEHVLFECHLYDDIREELIEKAVAVRADFINLPVQNKMIFVFSNPAMIRCCAKTCFNILHRRSSYLCNLNNF